MTISADETVLTPALSIPLRTLIVHDGTTLAVALVRDVQHAGFSADLVGDARAALASLDTCFMSVVIIDLKPGDVSSLQLCREIRARKYPGYVYIIVRSASQDEETEIEAYKAGADDYLTKNSSPELLAARLKAADRILSNERRLVHMLSERRKLSFVDPLTSAFNRRYFLKYGDRAVIKARDEGQGACLLLLDLDHFKAINDRFGHDTGDRVLIEFVRRIQLLLKDDEWCSRLGGEEFAVFLPRSDPTRAKHVAERIRKAVAGQPFGSDRLIIPVTVSIGAAAPVDGMGIRELMRRADKALYQSKRSGRNRSTVLSRRS